MVVTSLLVSPLTALGAGAGDAGASTRMPRASSLAVHAISGAPYGVRTPIHVLTFDPSQYTLEVDLANHSVDGTLETPSAMCRSTPGCVASVNGDYFDVTRVGALDPGDEVGGIIQNCVLLHTPEISHQQVSLDDHSVSPGLTWRSSLTFNGTVVAISGINQELPMRYQGVNLPLAGTLLYTAPYALKTPSAPGRVTYLFAQGSGAQPPTTINSSTVLTFVGVAPGPVTPTTGQVAISALAGSALGTLQAGASVTLTTSSTGGCNDIGGHPILIANGVPVPVSPADAYLRERYARTVLGWTASGETVLMTVEGVDNRSGATAFQLIRLLRALKVVTAIALDGGNSTSLYANGRVLYHAGRGERPVSTGLLVVPST
jgi:Phosphodiester glycosidase